MPSRTHTGPGSPVLLRRFAHVLRTKGLVQSGDRVLVAVSGGPDSVALLSLFSELAPSWKMDLWALHINHGLRGEESERDASFVAALCDRLGIRLRTEQGLLSSSPLLRRGHSLQERAREVRYGIMRKVGERVGVDKIALGHTADDQAETVLMWMLRGSGTTGLAGIPHMRESTFIRPLLAFRRGDLLTHLETRDLPFRTDSSNLTPVYLRNRVRQELLPLLHRFNPAIVDVLGRQAGILREEDRWLESFTSEEMGRMVTEEPNGEWSFERTDFLTLPLPLQRRLVRRIIQHVSGIEHGLSLRAVSAVLHTIRHGSSGSSMVVRGARILRDYGKVLVRSVDVRSPGDTFSRQNSGEIPAKDLHLSIPTTLDWLPTGQSIQVWLSDAQTDDLTQDRTRSPSVGLFDADRFTRQLVVRCWKPGDAFCPLGMGGHRKKLQDFFSDIKLSRRDRHRVPVLVAPEGILWVAGYRADHRFRVTSSTKQVLHAALHSPAS